MVQTLIPFSFRGEATAILHQAEVTTDRRRRATTGCRGVIILLHTPVRKYGRMSIPFSLHVQRTGLDG